VPIEPASGAVNPAGKLTTIIAAMMCGADNIDDVNVLRAVGTPRVFDEVYAPPTLGIFLREFTFGHTNQLAAVAREHLGGTHGAHPAAARHRATSVSGHQLAKAPSRWAPQTGAKERWPQAPGDDHGATLPCQGLEGIQSRSSVGGYR